MIPSRRSGRPPRPPTGISIRMAKAQARRKRLQGIFVLISAFFHVFLADFCVVALPVQCESTVGVAASITTGSLHEAEVAVASSGPKIADSSRGTISGGTISGGLSGGTISGGLSGGPSSLKGVDLDSGLDSGPSFLLCSPFADSDEDVRVLDSDEDARVVEKNNDEDGRVIEDVQLDRRRGKKPLRLGGFTDLDPELVTRVNSAFENPLETKDEWIRGRFDAWRLHVGKPIESKIEEIALDKLADNLEEFMLCVRRIDGKPYPPDTLQNLFRGFNRILRRAQDARMMNNREEEKIIDIYHDVKFMKARKALEVAMQESAAGGFVTKRKKSDIISREDQLKILAHAAHQVTNNLGLQKRFAFYCMSRFLIRGGKELCKVRDFQFYIGKDFVRNYLEYCETTSKNWHGGINKCKPEDFREPVRCYEEDVIECWRHLEFRLPKYEVKDKFGGRFVFLQAINRPRTNTWYNTNHASSKTMSTWLKDMLEICDIEGNYTNKSCRTTAITQMSVSGVPIEIGMKITGHKDPKSYQRYDQSGVVAKASAMDVLNSGKSYMESFSANVRTLNSGLSGNAEKAAALHAPAVISGPLHDISNTFGGSSSGSTSAGIYAPLIIDDEYMSDLDLMLEKSPSLQKYFPNPNAKALSGGVSITGNKIENVVIHVGSLSEAKSVVNSLK